MSAFALLHFFYLVQHSMRTLILFLIIVTYMSALTLAQTLPAPQAITDPEADHQQTKRSGGTEPAESIG